MIDKIEYILKHSKLAQAIYRVVFGSLLRFVGFFVTTDPTLVLFSSYSGKRFDDSPRCLYEEMLRKKECEKLTYVWAFRSPGEFDVPDAVRVKIDTPKYFYYALKAKYWITNVNIERGLNFKKKSTVYLNTWHGTPIKLIGNAVDGRSDYDFSNVDIITSDGSHFSTVMLECFGAKRESILECGRPSDDFLYRYRDVDRFVFRKKLGIEKFDKVVLYAPTWRESYDKGASYVFKPPISTEKWKSYLGDSGILLFRGHSITSKVLGIEFGDHIVDVTDYPDVNDLMLASDVLISDYSGIFFDYAITSRPMFCFCFDFDEYSKGRGMYFDIRKYLSSFSDEDSLLEYLGRFDLDFETNKTKAFRGRFISNGGGATDKALSALLQKGCVA